jgi:hypothetical protein
VGAFQVAVIVLPRPGFTRLAPTTIDCKYALGDHIDAALVDTDWAGLCKSASSTTLLVLRH